ncbi:MAG: DUF3021 domain-containing protein [Ruminococcus sp.]|nr:DUF3021 domain-containing protein [Ruminococcus sp.]
MKDTIKMVISHFFIITVCVTAAIGIPNYFSPDHSGYPTEFPIHMLLIGATSALPSFLYYFKKEPTRKQFVIRVILHFCCIMAVVLGEGWLLGWYENATDMIYVAICVIVVYAAVWIITTIANKTAADGINTALKNINSDEDEEP